MKKVKNFLTDRAGQKVLPYRPNLEQTTTTTTTKTIIIFTYFSSENEKQWLPLLLKLWLMLQNLSK